MPKKIILILLIILLFFLGCEKKNEEPAKTEDKFSGARNVKTVSAIRKDVSEYLEYSGTLVAENVINISPAIPTIIKEIFVDEGDFVKKGDLLVKMDDSSLIQAVAQVGNLQKNYNRMLELNKSGSIDEKSFEEVQTAYIMAQSNFEFLLENTEIKAPFDGMITLVSQKAGETYNSMMDPVLIRLLNLSEMKVKVNISERDISKLKIGQRAIIRIDSDSDTDFFGKIIFLSPAADQFSGTFLCEITLNNPENILKHNQFCRLRILTQTKKNAIILPLSAVVNSDQVFLIQNNKAVRTTIETGITNEEEIEIISGIEEDDEVIVEGNIGLRDNDEVRISRAER